MLGKRAVVETVVAALLARGHVLVEDVPGVGKTILARSLARSLDAPMKRIQCTPDLLPSDVTGASIYNPKTLAFEFRRGPIFAPVVLADEINRATPRTQSAFLEAMEERQVTADGDTHALPDPFFLIATQNPIELAGTFPLPEAQLDRFLVRVSLGYPDAATETKVILAQRETHPLAGLRPVVDLEQLRARPGGGRPGPRPRVARGLRPATGGRDPRARAGPARGEPARGHRSGARGPGARASARRGLRHPGPREAPRPERAGPPHRGEASRAGPGHRRSARRGRRAPARSRCRSTSPGGPSPDVDPGFPNRTFLAFAAGLCLFLGVGAPSGVPRRLRPGYCSCSWPRPEPRARRRLAHLDARRSLTRECLRGRRGAGGYRPREPGPRGRLPRRDPRLVRRRARRRQSPARPRSAATRPTAPARVPHGVLAPVGCLHGGPARGVRCRSAGPLLRPPRPARHPALRPLPPRPPRGRPRPARRANELRAHGGDRRPPRHERRLPGSARLPPRRRRAARALARDRTPRPADGQGARARPLSLLHALPRSRAAEPRGHRPEVHARVRGPDRGFAASHGRPAGRHGPALRGGPARACGDARARRAAPGLRPRPAHPRAPGGRHPGCSTSPSGSRRESLQARRRPLLAATLFLDLGQLAEVLASLRARRVQPVLVAVDMDSFVPIDQRSRPRELVLEQAEELRALAHAHGALLAILDAERDLPTELARPDWLEAA